MGVREFESSEEREKFFEQFDSAQWGTYSSSVERQNKMSAQQKSLQESINECPVDHTRYPEYDILGIEIK